MSAGRGDDVRAVANEVLTQSLGDAAITNLSMQKIVYFLHGQYMLSTGSPLVSGYFEAWEFGPVHPMLYGALKEFGRRPIDRLLRSRSILTGEWGMPPRLTDSNVRDFVIEATKPLTRLTAGQLVELSHAKNTPWDVATRTSVRRTWGARLDNELIKRHFRFHKRSLSIESDGEWFEERPPSGD